MSTTPVRICCFAWVILPLLICVVLLQANECHAEDRLNIHPQVVKAEQERIDAIHRASRAAVSVFDAEGTGGGSGVVISPDGYALTNYHVVDPCGDFMHCTMADGRLYEAVLVGLDPTGDVAMIKLLGRDDFPVAELADSDQVRVGQWCFAVGNPFLLATNRQPTITYGIISGIHRYQYPAGGILEYADCIQTDAAINPGNSGGPLFNQEGKLIGINGRGSFEKRGRVNVGVGYAISINQIKHFQDCLRSGRIVDHATLGATVGSRDGRVVVSNILTSSDAYRRGLRYGDEIISFAGRELRSVNDFKNVLGIYPKGWRVPLVWQRDGIRFGVSVRLEGVHGTNVLADLVQGKAEPKKTPEKSPEDQGEKPDGKQEKQQDGKQEKQPEGTPDDIPVETPEEMPQDDSDQDPLPREIPFGGPRPGRKMEIPESAKQSIERRRGYANYYFNRINRERLWNGWSGNLNRTTLQNNWKITGKLETGDPIEMLIGDLVSGGRFPSGPELIDLQRDAADQLYPDDTGGLLLALYTWRQLVNLGPEKFGEVYYFGSLPLPVLDSQHEVLVATRDLTQSHLYFDEQSKMPVAMEMFPDVDTDPCELLFSDYRQVGDSMMPFEIRVIHAGKQYGRLTIDQYEFVVAKEKQ